MTMNDTSRSSAAGTTGPDGLEEGGSPASEPESLHDAGWNGSMTLRDNLSFVLWATEVWIKHLFGRHSFVDLEHWDISADGRPVVTVFEQVCWRCPERRPCPRTT